MTPIAPGRPMIPARLRSRTAQLILVVAVATSVTVFLVTVPVFRHFFDLGVYRGAVRSWLIDGGDLYDFRYQDTEYGFTYPPFAALVLSPLALTAWPVAVAAGIAVNTTAVVLLLRWYLVPVLRRHGWPVWTSCALAFCAILVFEPARDTFSFGQINLVLLVLCAWPRRGRWAGVGIGLAAAIKLTPAVFIGYLLITRQYRAAAVATGTAATATLAAALIAPGPSQTFWTSALWDTDRVGNLAYVSNQSLRGVVARLGISPVWWVAAVVVVLAVWWVRGTTGDHRMAFAVTGILGCLISPVTWVHHCVWLLPAIVWCVSALDRRKVYLGAAAYLLITSRLTWVWEHPPGPPLAIIGSNLYVWFGLALLVWTPIGTRRSLPVHEADKVLA